ncbi:hypothetical protein PLICRDRAFT_114791 [Plicaturopsis crispa FD-325 SS-3]|nr:hypothetical protein PLICRDRAFT_114791 [Plicaturopsis crispa FD-325 SS-3]
MDHLGSDESRIFQLQKTAIDDVQAIRSSYIAASQLFSDHGLGSSFRLPSLFKNLVKELELDAINTSSAQRLHHDLLDTCLTYACTHVLREIKYRAHIPVPGSYTLIGVADEWDCLEEGEIFASVYDDRTDMDLPITGRVLITRSPQIHPGDLQMVTAVRRPELEHLKNVVVFSCRGERSLPSCLGGGDLDGDPYNLILDPKLFPMRTSEPGSYISRPDKQTSEPCTVVDVADFVIDYINSDLVGYISILHLRFADLKGADCDECIRLAEAASWAVDFPKTGSPVEFSKLPRASGREKPDFLSYEGSNVGAGTNYYLSPKLLGRLFRNVPDMEDIVSDEQNQFPSTDGDVVYGALRRIDLEQIGLPSLLDPDDNLLQEMRSLLDEYSEQLFKIARAHTVSKHSGAFLTEAELVSGTIQAKWADHRKRKEAVTAMNLQTHELAKAIRKELRRTVSMALEDDQPDDDDDDEEDEEDDKAAQESEAFMRAWAAWTVAEEALVETPDAFGPPSFGLIALGALLETVKVMSDNAYSAY